MTGSLVEGHVPPKAENCREESSSGDAFQNAPLRVCFIIDQLRTGGTETQLLRMIEGFDRNQVVPYLCLLDGLSDSSRRLEPTDCSIVRLGVKKLIGLKSLQQAWKLRQLLREWQIDLVQVHFPDSTYFGVPVARWAGVKRIVRTRRDLFYWVTDAHRRWGRKLDQFYNRCFVDLMIANSRAVAEAAREQESPPASRIEIIPNGLSIPPCSQCENARPERPVPVVGIVSMLRPEKRVDLFIEAARLLVERGRSAHFEIVGDGPERDRLLALVDRYNLQNHVTFHGVVGGVSEFLARIDFAVLCSDTEGLSNAVIEYMAAGLPIVATAVGGNLDLLEDRVSALLCPAGDSTALAQGIENLLDEPEASRRLGAAARARCASEFDLQHVISRYERLYRELVFEAPPTVAVK